MTGRAAALAVLLSLTGACQASDSSDVDDAGTAPGGAAAGGALEDAASDEAALREISRAWQADVVAKDSAAIAERYAPDAVFVVPYEPPHRGTAAIRSAWGRLVNLPNVSNTWQTEALRVAQAGDVAWEWGTYDLSFAGTQGPVDDRGSFLVVWEKRDGEWKAVADIASSEVFPGPAPDAAAPAGEGAAPAGDSPPAGESPPG
jgi:uncharacterized protein (TIGR02246 family)